MTAFDEGLLSPVTAGHDGHVRDSAFLDALVGAELALIAAYVDVGLAPRDIDGVVARAFALDSENRAPSAFLEREGLIADAVAGGNPVIPLVGQIKAVLPEECRRWVHLGATSQDIWDTAMMSVAQRAVLEVRRSLDEAVQCLRRLSATRARDVVAARTLTQHAVPTTIGARAAGWGRGLERATGRLEGLQFPAQLGGAAGTLASFVQITGSPAGVRFLVEAFARRAGLDLPEDPWHVTRWPVTELGDALVQTLDAVGKLATDIATLSRPEIAEVSEGTGGGSSAMPQKQNPVEAVLIRSAALRAPQLGATLHLAAALAADERPDGAWHAEWPTLRELLRLALGASSHASSVLANLRIDAAAGSRNLALSGGLILSERLKLALEPVIGRARFDELIADASAGRDLDELVRALPEASGLDVDALLDPADYTGLGGQP